MFSVVTAVYTIGGLLGSLIANVVMDRYGRKGAVCASGGLVVLGSGLMGISGSLTPLIIGRCVAPLNVVRMSLGLISVCRTLVGAGAGFGLCVGPIFLAEIAPEKIKGAVGVSIGQGSPLS